MEIKLSLEESENFTRAIYKATSPFIRGRRAGPAAAKSLSVIRAQVSARTDLTARHARLCQLRLDEAASLIA